MPDDVTVTVNDGVVTVKGGKNELKVPVLRGVIVSLNGKTVTISLGAKTKQARSSWGTMRALIQNAVTGVVKEFEKTLILEGVGYRVQKEGDNLNLNIGFSHPIKYLAPEGIAFEVDKNSRVKIKGADKALVGRVAAEIRKIKEPEPYKGKGFHYDTEIVRRKAGKKAATTASAS